MLSRIQLTGAPSFSGTDCALEDLDRFNFVFGPNGTGKTTISRILQDTVQFPGTKYELRGGSPEVDVHVFNRDYISSTLQEADQLPGVFVLDDEDPTARAEYTSLTKPAGDIAQHEESVRSLTQDLGAINNQIRVARESLLTAAWAAREKMPVELRSMFDGFNGSREVFAEKLIGTVKTDPPEVEALLREAVSAFDQAGQRIDPIAPAPSYAAVFSSPGCALLGIPIAGSSEVSLASVIERLDNQDWVAEGRRFVSSSDDLCPFCQQELPTNFLQHLAEFFDNEYEIKRSALNTFQVQARESHRVLEAIIGSLEGLDSTMVNQTELAAVAAELRAGIVSNEGVVAAKVQSPTLVVELVDLDTLILQLNGVISATNSVILEHNERLTNRREAKAALVSRCWEYFAWNIMSAELSRFLGVVSATETKRQTLSTELEGASHSLEQSRQRAQALEAQLVSSAPAIARLNSLLKKVGFVRFNLAASTTAKDAYRLERSDGSSVEDTLSDGERTFIAFLYFYVQLESRHTTADARKLVAVIDDPISSLDSDVLFVVSSLVRRLIQTVHDGLGRLTQLVVLTHNAQFYLELTYERGRDRSKGLLAGRRFYELRRDATGDTVITGSGRNLVRSNYQRLWQVVREASSTNGPSDAGLENVLRRILENYFTVIGSYPDLDELMESSVGDDALAYKALLAWLHHGSHAFVDDFDYSPSNMSKDVYLRVFAEIFTKTDQTGHYEMMMAME
ncbi:MAG: hypothetical protein C0444_09710 [Microbacterium sp.]|nr:hypothetical protein [Microbacterium sp.]MBA4345069.1 hypothetical protein [Microbacterium sp.]